MKGKLFKGTKITGKNGNVYTVDSLISEGTGQGDIYKLRNDRKEVYAFKLFHTGNKKKNLEQCMKHSHLELHHMLELHLVLIE